MLMMMIMIMMPIKLIVLFEVKWHMCGTDSFVFSLVPQVGFKFLLFTQLFFVLTSSRFEIWPKFHFDSFYFTLYFCSSLYCSYYTCLFYTVHIVHVYILLLRQMIGQNFYRESKNTCFTMNLIAKLSGKCSKSTASFKTINNR